MLEAAEPVPSKLRGLDPSLSNPPTTAEAVVPTCTPHVSISKRSGRGGAGAGSSTGTMNSMTLAISHENAKRMLEASRAFNATLNKIQNQQGQGQSKGQGKVQIKAEANVPDHVRSAGAVVPKTDGTTEQESSKQQDPNAPKSPSDKKTLHELFLQAALASENELLVSHVQRMKKAVADGTYTNQEIKTCLLLFLDMDKSSKLLTAFEILGDETMADAAIEIDPDLKEAAKVSSEQTAKDESDERKLPTLTRINLMKMFRCFLSSISTCIHHQVAESSEIKNEVDSTDRPNKFSKASKIDSPGSARSKQSENTKDWTLSSQTCREIQEIATYATSRVIEHKFDEGTTSRTKAQRSEIISFQRFGSWYNSGGFSLVPWLELLDLAKWDYAGRAAAAAAAAANAKEKHQQSKRPKSFNLDPMSMDPIIEEAMDDFVFGVDSSLNSISTGANIDSDLCFSSQSATKPKEKVSSKPKESQRPLIYFEFAGSKENSIKINDYNLRALQNLVEKTGLSRRPPDEISNMFMKPAKRRRIPLSTKANTAMKGEPHLEEVLLVLSRDDFDNILQQLLSPLKQLSPTEKEFILKCFTIFFLCFAKSNNIPSSGLGLNHVNAKELAVGLSFLCVGNKSSKLALTFELIQEQSNGFLSQRSMLRYLRSYLSMLAAISLLSSSSSDLGGVTKDLSSQDGGSASLRTLLDSVEKGSRWTLDHFLRLHESKSKKEKKKTHSTMYTFEDFASWYSEGGCTIAPWLEFIDLKKFLSLLYEDEYTRGSVPSRNTSKPSSGFDDVFAASPSPALKRPSKESSASKHSVLPEHILFTFPLANRKSLVVLREDAAYVQTVVNQLGLLSSTPEKVWSELHSYAKSNPPPALTDQISKRHRSGTGKCLDVAQSTFVSALERVIPKSYPRKRSASSSTPQETLKNFFQSFDLNQVDRVAANQLMGGLTLLCEGKKSSKLKFAFGLFDTRDDKRKKADQSLCGKELFYFLRSFLIVMFSCCKQSLDLSANAVGRYISDTANMVTDDVMKYQWRTKRNDRVSFDEFGEWYNEGGFETASWLELLDLNKWVLLDKAKAEKLMSESNKPMKTRVSGGNKLKDKSNTHEEKKTKKKSSKKADIKKESEHIPECPPPPPEDFLDAHTDMLFDDDIAMGGIDDMDFLFSDASVAQDKENMKGFFSIDYNIDESILPEPVGISAASPKTLPLEHEESAKPLQFQLLTDVGQGGYMISISSRRVKLLKLLVTEGDLFSLNIMDTSEKILAQAVDGKLSKELFDDAMRNIIAISNSTGSKMTTDTQRLLSDLLSSVFSAFDIEKTGMVDANDLACGFTVLCGGRKSDKLEYAFDLLDKKNGNHGASKNEMVRYLQSFLTVLLTISSCSVGRETHENILRSLSGDTVTGKESSDLSSAIIWGSTWATNQMLKSLPIDEKSYEGKHRINFENFAEWYTKGGFSVIPWLELLDLRKWVLAELT